jgi:hypothetical protein
VSLSERFGGDSAAREAALAEEEAALRSAFQAFETAQQTRETARRGLLLAEAGRVRITGRIETARARCADVIEQRERAELVAATRRTALLKSSSSLDELLGDVPARELERHLATAREAVAVACRRLP